MLSHRLKRVLWFAPLLLLGAEAFVHLLQVIAGRVGSLYELEWMEGAMLQQVLRVVHGLPLYGEASLDFVPALYMPLYYGISAFSVTLFGENLFALRIVSVAASFTTLWLVYLTVRRAGGGVLAAILGLLLFAWTFPHTAFWFDVARVDNLWTCLLAASLYALLRVREQPSRRHLALLVAAAVAAFLAKQATLFLLPFVALAVLYWCGLRVALLFAAGFTAAALPLLVLLQLATGGDFFFYAFRMAGSHGVTQFGLQRFWLDVSLSAPFMLLAACLWPWLGGNHRRDRLGWLALLAGFVFLSLLSRAYAGSFFNVLMPLYCCAAVMAAMTYGRLVERAVTGLGPVWLVVVLLLAGMSFDMYRHRYEPAMALPLASSQLAYHSLQQRIADVEGPVCVTAHGYLAWLAGKDFCAHNTQVTDLVTGTDPVRAQHLRDDARHKILSGYYAAIVLDREKELNDLGLQLSEIPYTVSRIHYPQGPMQFPVNGRPPTLWLQYNGLPVSH